MKKTFIEWCEHIRIVKYAEEYELPSFLQNMEPKTAITIEIKKYNRKDELCYFDSICLVSRDVGKDTVGVIEELFKHAGFEVKVIERSYFGIYDPTRYAEIIQKYPTNEELLERELINCKMPPYKETDLKNSLFNWAKKLY